MLTVFHTRVIRYKGGDNTREAILAIDTGDNDLPAGARAITFFVDSMTSEDKNGDDNNILNLAGWPATGIGRPDIGFTGLSGRKQTKFQTISVSQKTEG